MGHAWEAYDESDVDASPEQVWHAIATGPGIDSWFMGRTEVQPGVGGSIHTDMGGYSFDSAVTAWEPPRRFAYRGDEAPDGRFIAYEYLIEGREQGSTVLRLVANGFLPGDDWEAEFEAMTLGGKMYFQTLVAYLNHFAGRSATPVPASGPHISDWTAAWEALGRAFGLARAPRVGDRVEFTVDGVGPIVAVVDFSNAHNVGLRSNDALYRFLRSFFGGNMLASHHVFATDADAYSATRAWQAWLARVLS